MKTDKEFTLMGINQQINAVKYKIRDGIFERRMETTTDLLTLKQMIEDLEDLYAKRELLQEELSR